jgi:hypothetical protein
MTQHEPFIMIPHAVYDSPTFAALKPIDIAVLLVLIRKHNGHNNGAIPLGVRETARRCHCSQMTAYRALARLEKSELITAVYKGHLVPEIGRPNAATRWRLNFVRHGRFPSDTSRGEARRFPSDTSEHPNEASGRFPNDTSGRFPSDTSGNEADRFSSDTSLGASPVIQSIDYLTTAKPIGSAEPEPPMRDIDGVVVQLRVRRTSKML